MGVVSKTKHSKTKTEARSTQISKTKHPELENEAPKSRKRSTQKLENEDPKNSKTKTPKLETGLSFINTRQSLANTAGIQHDNVRVQRASLTLRFQTRFRTFVLVLANTCIRQNAVSFEVYINIVRLIIKLIQDILSRNVQLNSLQAFIKPWDGFCRPLEVRTHPLLLPDSDCVMLDVKL